MDGHFPLPNTAARAISFVQPSALNFTNMFSQPIPLAAHLSTPLRIFSSRRSSRRWTSTRRLFRSIAFMGFPYLTIETACNSTPFVLPSASDISMECGGIECGSG